ncbi:peroxidase [Sarracenia purpurea var. burkii]
MYGFLGFAAGWPFVGLVYWSLVLPFAWPVCQLAFVDNLGVGFAFVYSLKWLSILWELLQQKGLLHSNQELVNGGNSESADLVRYYSGNSTAFRDDFSASMIKMGNLKLLTGSNGEIRMNCKRVN